LAALLQQQLRRQRLPEVDVKLGDGGSATAALMAGSRGSQTGHYRLRGSAAVPAGRRAVGVLTESV